VSGPDQLLGIGPGTILEARIETVLRIRRTPLCVEMEPLPSFKPPFQTADPLRFM